jgi:hypothetical protein
VNERPTFLDGLRDDLVTGRDRLLQRRRRARRVAGASATAAVIVAGVVFWPGDDDERPFVATEEPSTTADQRASSSSTATAPVDATTSTAVDATGTAAVDQGLRHEGLPAPPLEARAAHSVVWTGREVIVWGGWRDDLASLAFADGAAYDPATGTWRTIAPAPIPGRGYHAAAWTGTEMIVVGGEAAGQVGVADGAAYDPATDRWRLLPDAPRAFPTGSPPPQSAAWADDHLVVWMRDTDEVFALDPDSGAWATLASTTLPDPAYRAALRWTGEELIAFTGQEAAPQRAARLLADDDGWQQLPELDFTSGCCTTDAAPENSVAIDGTLIAWSGRGGDAPAFALDAGSNEWREIPPVPLRSCDGSDLAFAIGADVVAIGRCGGAGRYAPATGTWTDIAGPPGSLGPLENADLTERYVAWTGEQLIALAPTCCYSPSGPHHEWALAIVTLPPDVSAAVDPEPGPTVADLPLTPVGEEAVPADAREVMTSDAVIVAAYRIGDTGEVLTLTSSDGDPSTYCIIPPDFQESGAMCVDEITGGLSISYPERGDAGWVLRVWVDVETPTSIEQFDGTTTYRQEVVGGISILPTTSGWTELTVRTFDSDGVVLDERTE